MKKRPVVIAFLLMLYITPVIFGISPMHTGIPTEQNINKDFMSADIGDISPQSITSFDETLPDNVLYYPDALGDDTVVLACAGEADDPVGDYTDTWVVVDYFGDANGPDDYYVTLNFTSPRSNIDAFNIALLMGVSNIQYSYLYNYVTEEWDLIGSSTSSPPQQWVNASGSSSHIGNDLIIQYKSNGTDASGYMDFIYYAECNQFQYTTNPFMLEQDPTPRDGGTYYLDGGDDTGTCYLAATSDDDDDFDGLILNGDGLNGIGDGGGVIPSTAGDIRFSLDVTISAYSEGAGSEMYLSLIASSAIALGGDLNYFAQEDIDGNGELTIEGECGLDTVGSIVVCVNFTGSSIGDSVNVTCNSYYFYVAGGEHVYSESFADVSDWTNAGLEGGDTFTTDGDVGEIDTDSTAGSDYAYTNSPSISAGANYVEIRYRLIGTATYVRIYYWTADTKGGSNSFDVLSMSGNWETGKFLVETDIECVELTMYKASATDMDLEIDYIRIGPSNEMGWQHDGSITDGTQTNGVVSSDGDELTFTADTNLDWMYVFADTTTTRATMELDYYQFIEFRVSSANGSYRVDAVGSTNVTIHDYSSETGVFKYNIEAVEGTIDYFDYLGVYLSNSGTYVIFDYIKLYSIANFTLTSGSSNTIDDVLYCEDDILYSLTTNGADRYWTLDYDPSLSIPTIFNQYSLGVTTNTQWFAEYVGSWQSWKVDEPTGTLTKGTVTDFKILIDGTTALSSILFIESLGWETLDGVTFYFVISSPYGNWAIQALLIFLGLFMIPASTLYLAHGGKNNMSTDKLLYGLLAFVVGWGLLLGGIFA